MHVLIHLLMKETIFSSASSDAELKLSSWKMLKRSVGFIERPAADSTAVVKSASLVSSELEPSVKVASASDKSGADLQKEKKSWGIGAQEQQQQQEQGAENGDKGVAVLDQSLGNCVCDVALISTRSCY